MRAYDVSSAIDDYQHVDIRNINHSHPDHVPCHRVCVACRAQVLCDVYFANDHACDACARKADALATAEGGFFPKGVAA